MPVETLIYRNLWVAVGWALVLTVTYLSLVPSPPEVGGPLGDKGAHLLAYGSMMFWFGCLYTGPARASAAMGLLTMGLALELLQSLGQYRTAEPLDMLANGLGIATGWLLALTPASRFLGRVDSWLAGLSP